MSIKDIDQRFSIVDKEGRPTDYFMRLLLDRGDTLEGKLTGDPNGSTDNAVVRWNGTTGNAVENSSVLVNDAGDLNVGATGAASRVAINGLGSGTVLGAATLLEISGDNHNPYAFTISNKTAGANYGMGFHVSNTGGFSFDVGDSAGVVSNRFGGFANGGTSIMAVTDITFTTSLSYTERAKIYNSGCFSVGAASDRSAAGVAIKGNLWFQGATSGVITLQSAAVAGTYSLTLPTTAGTAGQALVTDGSGVLSWSTVTSTVTLTGDVTGTGSGSFATTIANDAVTNAKMANMATATFKGRTTAGTGDPEDLTATQATAMLNTFTAALKGLVPAPVTSSGTYLRDDGTWGTPSGGVGGAFRGALVTKSADQTAANYSGTANIAWDSEVYDTDSIHDNVTNNSRLTVPAGVSKVRVSCNVDFSNVTANTDMNITIIKNGTTFTGSPRQRLGSGATVPSQNIVSAPIDVTPGDYFEARLYSADTSITVSIAAGASWFAMELLA